MVTVAVTGIGGLVGRRLAADLGADDDVEEVRGLDVRPPSDVRAPGLTLQAADVRDAGLAGLLDGVDVLVHLAFQMDPVHDDVAMRSVNVDGTRNVFAAAVAAGVPKIVYTSTGAVYGAHPDNDLPLVEDSPLRANPGLSYVEHKYELERWLAGWMAEHPDTTVTILRPTIIAGHGVSNFITRATVDAPRFPAVRNHRPPMQFVHPDDVASAVHLAVRDDLPGAYNVSAEGWLSFDEITAIMGRRVLEVPEEVAFSSIDRLWRLGVGEAPAGVVHYWMHPWVMSVDRLVDAGWRPKHSNRDALAELAEDHRDQLALGPVHAHRSTLWRAAGVALAAGTGLATWGLLRRRRR